jgi:hypothetical protein
VSELAAPCGEVRVFAQYDRDFTEQADVVVVGSGPGGAVVVKELVEAGKRVVLLEEGPPFTPDDFELDGTLSMVRTIREAGLRTTLGTVMPTMQAVCLGGGSFVNSAICVRAPEFVFDEWCDRYELKQTSRADLDPHYDAVGSFLGIAATPEAVQGRRNLLFREACEALGYHSEPAARNVRGCRGSGECLTGCRARAKQSMDISYVPAAVRGGARVLTSTRVERVITDGARALGVAGRVVQPFTGEAGHRFRVNAGVVVLAAGCMATPVILQKSGNLANRSGQVGEHLRFHPGVAASGIFEERVDPSFGATQGYQSLQFLREGFKLETLWAPRLGRHRELQSLCRARARPPGKQPRPEAGVAPPARGRADPGPGALHPGRALLRRRRPHRHPRGQGRSGGAAFARRGAGPAHQGVPPHRFRAGGQPRLLHDPDARGSHRGRRGRVRALP